MKLVVRVAVAAAAFIAAMPAFADAPSRVPLPTIAVDRSTQCVEPPEIMRRLHPEMLRHQRDRTVRDGARDAKVSLAACVECHAASGAGVAAGSVTGSAGAFCESCHRYTAVKIDCFECHRSKPANAIASRAVP
jgi:hypothetical protein